jgi:mannose/cellobiose epimerase-like protein (N-acyl-D-glucosamine 2-epimerase family)
MKRIIILLLTLFTLNTAVDAQYNTQSEHFNNPELLLDYVQDCANFWSGVEDTSYGGFFTDIGRSGNILNSSTKGLVSLSRNAYGFSRAFMMTGDTSYLLKVKGSIGLKFYETTPMGHHLRRVVCK